MFELEIMVTGYTVLVATTTVVISKYIGRKQLNNINNQLSIINSTLLNTDTKIKELEFKIEQQTKHELS